MARNRSFPTDSQVRRIMQLIADAKIPVTVQLHRDFVMFVPAVLLSPVQNKCAAINAWDEVL